MRAAPENGHRRERDLAENYKRGSADYRERYQSCAISCSV